MELINIAGLKVNKESLIQQWNDPSKPFRYLVYDNFFHPEKAELILENYPNVIDKGQWDGTTYIHQKNKFTKTKFDESEHVLQQVFNEMNDPDFLTMLSEFTGIDTLLGDEDLFGGGLHQSLKGAFLNVHVDFNLHEKTKYHRRMNAIVYMNKNWKEEYNGYLELWDMRTKTMIANVAPVFNRLVIFETNEVSYHGHPKPLNTPSDISRKSLAVYYYTKERPLEEIAAEHNTVYVNTEGNKGVLKVFLSGMKALKERLFK